MSECEYIYLHRREGFILLFENIPFKLEYFYSILLYLGIYMYVVYVREYKTK
jgi:hypothetical protein